MASQIWQLTGTKQWEESVKLLRKATDPLLNASCSKYWELLFYTNLLKNNPAKIIQLAPSKKYAISILNLTVTTDILDQGKI